MMKVRCSCGALLSVEQGLARFRCPQCQKILKLPASGGAGGGGQPQGGAPAPGSHSSAAGSAPSLPPEEGGLDVGRARKARVVSRLQLALLGLVGVLLFVPLQQDRTLYDQMMVNAKSFRGSLGFLGMAELLMPLGAIACLLGAILPIKTTRGVLVAGIGGAMLVLLFGHAVQHQAELSMQFGVLRELRFEPLMAIDVIATVVVLWLVAVAQTRFYAPQIRGLKVASICGGLIVCGLYGLSAYLWKDLLNAEALKRLSDVNLVALVGFPVDKAEGLSKLLPYLWGTACGGMALVGLLSLLGFVEHRLVSGLTGFLGTAAILALPIGVIALAAPTWGGMDGVATSGRQLTFGLATLYAPILMIWLGLRDYMAEVLHRELPADE